MPFQNIFIDVGEENTILLPEDFEHDSDFSKEQIDDMLFQKKIRSQELQEFIKYKYTEETTVIEKINTKTGDLKDKKMLQIIPHPNLFQRPSSMAPLHGESPILHMRQKIQNDFDSFKNKLFTVVNRNTAHQMSFFLADFAFRKFGNPGHKKVVINIDQHLDYGTSLTKSSGFMAWGGNAVAKDIERKGEIKNPIEKNGFIYQDSISGFNNYKDVTYIAVGISSVSNIGEDSSVMNTSIEIKNRIDNALTEGKKIQEIKLKANDFMKNKETIYEIVYSLFLREIFDKKLKMPTESDTDYYITFDTDAMLGSNTHYPSGIYNYQFTFSLIKEILRKIAECKDFLVGFDVTGLPIKNKRTRNAFDFANYDDSYSQIETIIYNIGKLLKSF